MIELDFALDLAPFALQIRASLSKQVTAIVGASGSGKTSLLETIAGLRRDARGRVAVEGTVLFDAERGISLPPEQRRVGYVPQSPSLFPHLTVRGNVRYGLRETRDSEQRFVEVVSMLEIARLLDRRPSTLSGGEAQRVALARAVMTSPQLLLLDEPLAALDQALKGRILPYLMRLRDDAKIPMLYVTHHVGEALAMAEHAIVLARGTIAVEGPVGEALSASRLFDLHPEATFENVVTGVVAAIDAEGGVATLALDTRSDAVVPTEIGLSVPASRELSPGRRAAFRVRAEDVLVARQLLSGLSARNQLEARVIAVDTIGTDALVRLSAAGREWRARLTPRAARELDLAPGHDVWLAIKTHAFEPMS